MNIMDWFIGASGFDGKILGVVLHPAIGITLLSISTLLIFEHIRDKAKSGDLYGNPLCTLGLQSLGRTLPKVMSQGGNGNTLKVRSTPVELKPVLKSSLSLLPTVKIEPPIELSRKELMGKFESLTTAEAKSIARSYIGKALLVVAEVADVRPSGADTLVFLHPEDSEGRMDVATASFGPDWKDRVKRLHRGDRIKVYGIISELPDLSLKQCKLMTEKLVPDYE